MYKADTDTLKPELGKSSQIHGSDRLTFHRMLTFCISSNVNQHFISRNQISGCRVKISGKDPCTVKKVLLLETQIKKLRV